MRRLFRPLITAVLALASAGTLFFQLLPSPDAPLYLSDFQETETSFAALGDTQDTLWVERALLGRERNLPERGRLLADLARQKVDFIIHLGDLVALNSREDWRAFDEAMTPLLRRPILPLLGNHDVFGSLGFVRARFPRLLANRWYARSYRGLRLIWLDSNARGAELEAETGWLAEQLVAADGDASIRAIAVLTHHPPFTNSTVTGDDETVGRAFVPHYLRSRKAILFLSGHAHALEHFVEGGKTFVVSGGAGGPRVGLHPPGQRGHEDRIPGAAPRPFHYLLLTPGERGLELTVRGFDRGEEPRELRRISIPYRE